jgi:hypothetical protein
MAGTSVTGITARRAVKYVITCVKRDILHGLRRNTVGSNLI